MRLYQSNSFVCYWILGPILNATGVLPSAAELTQAGGAASYLRVQLFRPVGIGMLIGGALTGIVLAFPLVVSAVKSMQNASKVKAEVSKDELPVKLLYFAIAGAAIVLLVMALLSTKEVGIGRGLIMAALGTLRPQRGVIRRARGLEDGTEVGYVPQRFTLDATLPTTVGEFVDLGLVGLGLSRDERRRRAAEALDWVELETHARRSIWAHSEGQRQRTS